MLKKLHEQKLFYLALILVVADQLTKIWVKGFSLFGIVHEGMGLGNIAPLIGDTIRLNYVENPGMAFGIEFGAGKVFLSLFSIIAAIALGWYLYRLRTFSIWVQVGVMLLLAGATGNLIDRVFYGVFYGSDPLFYGKVVDFLDVDIPDITLFGRDYPRFWIFNIADSCVSCGIVLLLFLNNKIPTFHQLIGKDKSENAEEPVVLEEYNSQWQIEFDDLQAVLRSALGEDILGIEHVGSTAVPGLAAKPILDIDIILESEEKFTAVKEKLIALGYIHEGDKGISGREAFAQTSQHTPLHENRVWMKQHLYVCVQGSEPLKKHLELRERLRVDEEARDAYSEHKKNLAQQFADNRTAYTEAKTEFISGLLGQAKSNDAPMVEDTVADDEEKNDENA